MYSAKSLIIDGKTYTVLSDYQGIFLLSRGEMRGLINALQQTLTVVTDEILLTESQENLLAAYPHMFPQVYGDEHPRWRRYLDEHPPEHDERGRP